MKKVVFSLLILFLFVPNIVVAQEVNSGEDQLFEAEVVRIINEETKTRQDGAEFRQQDLELIGLEGQWKDKKVTFEGVGELEVISQSTYEVGDKVMLVSTIDVDGNERFYITDSVRRPSLYWLFFIFCLVIVAIGKWKGIKALMGLLLSFVVIMKFIIPKILDGNSPLLISIVGAFAILLLIVYITEGLNRKSHLAVISISISLAITAALSIIYSNLARLTGSAQEEVMFLIGAGNGVIDFKGLLLAAIIIGALGVLDDVVISQISSVDEIKKANPDLSKIEVYKRAMRIGRSHLGSMVNTLFLAYAGASLPLLILFTINEPPFLTFSQVLNNELVATEIVRTLVGSIGLALAIPISTFIGAYYLGKYKRN